MNRFKEEIGAMAWMFTFTFLIALVAAKQLNEFLEYGRRLRELQRDIRLLKRRHRVRRIDLPIVHKEFVFTSREIMVTADGEVVDV